MKNKKIISFIIALLLISVLSLSACKKNVIQDNTEVFTFALRGEEYAITSYTGTKSEITLPTEHNGKPVTTIAETAFAYSNISKVIVSEGIKTIGDAAFSNSYGLYYIYIPRSITTIGENIFNLCSSLNQIEVHKDNKNFTSIDKNLYTKDAKTLLYYCINNGLTEFNVPEGTEKITPFVFNSSSIEKIMLPSTLKEVGEGAFTESSINEIIVSPNNTLFSSNDGILFSDNASILVCYPPKKSKDQDIHLVSGIKKINDYAFADTTFERLFLSDGIEEIKNHAFMRSHMREISIPSSVRTIGPLAFGDCINLYNIDVHINNQHYQDISGNLLNKTGTIFITYTIGKEEGTFSVPRGVNEIAKDAFFQANHLQEIEIPDTVNKIDNFALYSRYLRKIIINSNVPPIIYESTFYPPPNYYIYVPDGNSENYKNYNEIWQELSDYILEFYEL